MSETPTNDRSRGNPGVAALGDFIKSQRRLAELSPRELARLADLSDAYLSQLERGLHEPSVRVLNGLADALNLPSDKMLRFLGPIIGKSSVRRNNCQKLCRNFYPVCATRIIQKF